MTTAEARAYAKGISFVSEIIARELRLQHPNTPAAIVLSRALSHASIELANVLLPPRDPGEGTAQESPTPEQIVKGGP